MATAEPAKYDVFVSHAQADTAFAASLSDTLRRHGLEVCRLDERPRAGESFAEAVARAIEGARVCLVVLSDASDPATPWLSREWSAIQEASWRHPDLSICSVRLGTVDVPPFLRKWQSVQVPRRATHADEVAASVIGLLARASENPAPAATERERSVTAERFAELRRVLHELKEEEVEARHGQAG